MTWIVPWIISHCCFSRHRHRVYDMRQHSETGVIAHEEDDMDRLLVDRDFIKYVATLERSGSHWDNISSRLGSVLLIGPQWTMYTTEQGKMLQFATNCQDVWTRDVHPLVIDAWYSMGLPTLGITPQVEAISQPMPVTSGLIAQFNLTISEQDLEKCIAKGGSIRFMVIPEMAGYLPAAADAGSVTVYEALLIGRRLVHVLTLLHRNGVIHRNISPDSVWVRGIAEVQLIDFSRAGIGSYEGFGDELFGMSPWELENPARVRTRRDDVWRALRVVAILMHGKRFEEYERFVLEQHGMEYFNWWKFSGDIFAIPVSNPIVQAAVRPARTDIISPYPYIMRGFRKIMQAIACIDSNQQIGDYQKIIDSFDNHILPYVVHETRGASK